MAALTANAKVTTYSFDETFGGFIVNLDVAASTTIYQGAFVKLGTNGIIPCAGSGNDMAIGIAQEKVDNSSGAAGALQCDVLIGGTFVTSSITGSTGIADLGKPVFCTSDNPSDITNTQGTNEYVGTIMGYSGGSGNEFLVKMRGDIAMANQTYTITNDLGDRTYDANTVAVAELADVVATLITDLSKRGLINRV